LDNLAPLESCLMDIQDVVDWLQTQCAVSRVVLLGLCSGADHAVLYGYRDPRVVGLVLVDPTIPATSRYYAQYFAKRIRRIENWISVLRGRSGILGTIYKQLAAMVWPAWRRKAMTLQNLRSHPGLQTIYAESIANGLQILAVMSGDSTRQTYSRQIIDAFPKIAFGNQLQFELFEIADHLFSRQRDQSKLMDVVEKWLKECICRTLP
jgi:hypothetical protein